MGIGNTTAAAAIAAALFGGGGARWAGRGTGVDDAGLDAQARGGRRGARATSAILGDPLRIARRVRRTRACRHARRHASPRGMRRIPALLDGFVCTAAAARSASCDAGALDHALAGHVSAEAGHRLLLEELGLRPCSISACGLAKAPAPRSPC